MNNPSSPLAALSPVRWRLQVFRATLVAAVAAVAAGALPSADPGLSGVWFSVFSVSGIAVPVADRDSEAGQLVRVKPAFSLEPGFRVWFSGAVSRSSGNTVSVSQISRAGALVADRTRTRGSKRGRSGKGKGRGNPDPEFVQPPWSEEPAVLEYAAQAFFRVVDRRAHRPVRTAFLTLSPFHPDALWTGAAPRPPPRARAPGLDDPTESVDPDGAGGYCTVQ